MMWVVANQRGAPPAHTAGPGGRRNGPSPPNSYVVEGGGWERLDVLPNTFGLYASLGLTMSARQFLTAAPLLLYRFKVYPIYYGTRDVFSPGRMHAAPRGNWSIVLPLQLRVCENIGVSGELRERAKRARKTRTLWCSKWPQAEAFLFDILHINSCTLFLVQIW